VRNARHVMSAYRHYILATKRNWNLDRTSHGKSPARRIARALVHYHGYMDSYLKAKRAVVAGNEMVDA